MKEIAERVTEAFDSILNGPEEEVFPKVVYHYTSPEGFKGIIENKVLFATDMLYLNDVSESIYSMNLLENMLKTKQNPIKDAKLIQELEKRIEIFKKDRFRNNTTYAISFTLDEDSLHMWSYYTKGYSVQGYNIGFHSAELLRGFSKNETQLPGEIKLSKNQTNSCEIIQGKIEYDTNRQKKIIRSILDTFDRAIANYKITTTDYGVIARYIILKVFYNGLFFKDEHFKEEQEFRIVFIPMFKKNFKSITYNINYLFEKYRIKDGIMIPYKECKFDKACIKEVYCAPGSEEGRTDAGIFRMLRKDILKPIIKFSEIPLRY